LEGRQIHEAIGVAQGLYSIKTRSYINIDYTHTHIYTQKNVFDTCMELTSLTLFNVDSS